MHQRQAIQDKKPIAAGKKRRVFERRFWLCAAGVVLVSMVTRVFDFTLVPPMYNGIPITQSFCGLHSVDQAVRAWAARSHVKYGLGYTKGFRTLMVADPPPVQPQYYVSHPPLESWILALGMLVLGAADWSFRLLELLIGECVRFFSGAM